MSYSMQEPFRPVVNFECVCCGVACPGTDADSAVCRCCTADLDPLSERLGAETAGSVPVMDPPPLWEKLGNNPTRLELVRFIQPDGRDHKVGLWWSFKGDRWVAQHPMEFPIDRIRGDEKHV